MPAGERGGGGEEATASIRLHGEGQQGAPLPLASRPRHRREEPPHPPHPPVSATGGPLPNRESPPVAFSGGSAHSALPQLPPPRRSSLWRELEPLKETCEGPNRKILRLTSFKVSGSSPQQPPPEDERLQHLQRNERESVSAEIQHYCTMIMRQCESVSAGTRLTAAHQQRAVCTGKFGAQKGLKV